MEKVYGSFFLSLLKSRAGSLHIVAEQLPIPIFTYIVATRILNVSVSVTPFLFSSFFFHPSRRLLRFHPGLRLYLLCTKLFRPM